MSLTISDGVSRRTTNAFFRYGCGAPLTPETAATTRLLNSTVRDARPLSALDMGLLGYRLANPEAPLAVGYLLEVAGRPPSVESLRTHVGHRVSLSPPLAATIVSTIVSTSRRDRVRNRLSWSVDPGFNPADHVHEYRLPVGSGQPGLRNAVDSLSTLDIPLSKPPWQVWLISGYRPDGFAVLYRASHVQVDGTAMNTVLGRIFGPTGTSAAPTGQTSTGQTSTGQSSTGQSSTGQTWSRRADQRLGVRAVGRAALGSLGWVGRTATVHALTGPTTGQPRHTWATVDVERLRAIGRAHGATVNDVFLAALAGALPVWSPKPVEDAEGGPDRTSRRGASRWHMRLGRRRRRMSRVHVSMPVSTRRAAESELISNYVAGVRVALPWDENSASRRLEIIRRQTARHKRDGNPGAAERLFFEATPTRLRPAALAAGFASASVAFSASNIGSLPGALEVLGRRVTAASPVVPLCVGQRLAVVLGGLGDAVCVGFVADAAVPNPAGLTQLFLAELDGLEAAAGLDTRRTCILEHSAAKPRTVTEIPRPRSVGGNATSDHSHEVRATSVAAA